MNEETIARLRAEGWEVGDVNALLGLTPQEVELLEMRVRLAAALRRERTRNKMTQSALAERMGSSQSRVAKIERGDPSVSLDLMLRALVSLGASRQQVAAWLAAG